MSRAALAEANTSGAPKGAPTMLELQNLSKTFGGQRALDGVSLSIAAGEVHGLLGQNGSGKSTLIKILAGFHAPDPGGELTIQGRAAPLPLPPGAARRLGLSFVHQHLGLILSLTVLDNMMLGRLSQDRSVLMDWRAERSRCQAALHRYGVEISTRAVVASLQPVERALLAIVRAVEEIGASRSGGGILVLDEPTPFLPKSDVETLFAVVRRVASHGASVIFVSHDVDEVKEITDRCTILRDGCVVATLTTLTTSKAEFVEGIVGRKFERHARGSQTMESAKASVVIEGLSGQAVDDVSMGLSPGEVVGLTGLVGSGYADVPYLLYGARKASAGSLTRDGLRLDVTRMSPARAIGEGIVLIPGDRANSAAISALPIVDNVTMPVLETVFRSFALARGAMIKLALDLGQRFEVLPNRPTLPLSALSGGNQQKVMLAKWLQTRPRLVLLDEPTQGVDVGAREAVFAQIAAATAGGAIVICASSDYEQLEQTADRVLIFAGGKIVAELKSPFITKSAIAELCYAHSDSLSSTEGVSA
jgi:ribose transport system ATP-binding protein